MSEKSVIERTPAPRTRAGLTSELRSLGVTPGQVVLVHSSLSALGWVDGGEETVIHALLDALGELGTLVMPAHTGDRGDPAEWRNPPIPPEWIEPVRENMPPYNPATTPTRGMGRIAELFRTWPGTLRSLHPHVSFAARGPLAASIVSDHPLDYSLGDSSPLGKIYAADGWVLLLGVGYDRNTSFHLAEYRVSRPAQVLSSAPVLVSGQREWANYRDVDLDSDPFGVIGEEFEKTSPVRCGGVGSSRSRLFQQRPAVDFARDWLQRVNTDVGPEVPRS